MTNYQSDLAIHPGEFLEEVLEEKSINSMELASKINTPKETIDKIIEGQIGIDSRMASALESIFGIPSHIWIGLDEEYSNIKIKMGAYC